MIHHRQIHFLVGCLFALASAAQTAHAELIDDFDDDAGLSQRWTALGEVTAARVAVPDSVQHEGVTGNMLQVKAGAGAIVAVKDSVPRPDWARSSHLRFRARTPSASRENPMVIEVRSHSTRRRAWRWRKVEFVSDKWQTVELPLAYFRASGQADVPWSEVKRLSIYFRNRGELQIDTIEVVRGKNEQPAYPNVDDLAKFAFDSEPRRFDRGDFVILTDADELDGEAVLDELQRFQELIYDDFPDWKKPYRPVVLLVFAERDAFATFWQRLGRERFASEVPIIRAGGYAIFGLAGSYYDDTYGKVRPVYVQEACHAMLAQVFGIANTGEWLHEGIANYYQLQWSKQDILEVNKAAIQEGNLKSLVELCNGEPIGQENYAQVTLFVHWLIIDESRRKQLTAAIAEMRLASSTDIAPHSKKHFGKDLPALEEQWRAWARAAVK